MASLLFIFWITLLVQAQTNNVCIWDRRGDNYLNNMLNGQYFYDGSHNDHGSWKKSQHANCGPSLLYIYWHQYNFWAIGTSLGAHSYYAQCEESDIASCVAGKWGVAENSKTDEDPAMRVIYGNCPSWNCGTITTNAPDDNCKSFTQQIAINTWKSSSTQYVWTLNTMYLAWICVNDAQYDHTDCSASYAVKTSSASATWSDLSSGDSTSLNIEFSSPSQARLTVTCTGSGAPQPTPQPVPTPQPTAVNSDTNTVAAPSAANKQGNTAWIIVVVLVIVMFLCAVAVWFVFKIKKERGYKEATKDEYADTVQMNQPQAQQTPWVRTTNIQSTTPNTWEQQNMYSMYNQGVNPFSHYAQGGNPYGQR